MRLLDRVRAAGQILFRGNLKEPPPWLLSMLGAPTSAAGVDVIPETAISLSTVWCCVNILSQTIGCLPLFIERIEHDADGHDTHSLARDHLLWDMLHLSPNQEMTSMIWRGLIMTHLGLWGNHYSQIVRDRLGRPLMLQPLHPQRVRVMREEGGSRRLQYQVSPMYGETGMTVLPMEDVLHIRGLSMNGLVGLSPIGAARECIGIGLATQEYGARFFSNDSSSGAVLEHPGQLGDEAYKRLKADIERQRRALKDKHRMLILEEGMKLTQMGIPPEDAQFLATRTFQVAEVARYYRMPLYKLSENLNTKNANVEQVAIEFVTDTVMPWIVNIESELSLKLFSSEERRTFKPRFDIDELLRGDFQARHAGYTAGRQWGYYSANDVRRKEHLNPIAGGDSYMVPLNMVPSTDVGKASPPAPLDNSRALALLREVSTMLEVKKNGTH
jgi:HK97 family phage portal protein